MDFLQLEYFLKLAKYQHVSHTAKLLLISQPSLSATIKKLEDELGVKLFIRKGRNITLSPYGELFREHVEDAFRSLENARNAIDRMKNSDNNTLKLGILSPYIWNDVMCNFRSMYPEIQINISSIEKKDYIDNIISGEIDFYLGGINQIEKSNTAKIEYTTLYEDDMVLLINKSHPFAGRKEISLSECCNEKFIHLNPTTNLQQFIDLMWEKAGLTPDVVMSCDYTLRDLMVSENYGISITTMQAAAQCNFPNVTFTKITNPLEKRKLGLVWRKNELGFTPSMQKFYDAITTIYKKHMI